MRHRRKIYSYLWGEWNPKVGRGDEPGMVGSYGLGNRNEAGEQLLEFCEENDLFQANAYTWTSPDGQCRNQIDYIPSKRQWRSAFQSVKTRPEADCGSDHKLLRATVRIKLKNRQHVEKGWKLDTENIPEEYKTEIKQKLATINIQGGNSGETWIALKDAFREVANKTIPRKEKRKGTFWMSQDKLRVVENRQQMKMKGNWVEVRKQNGQIQTRISKDKEI